MVYHGVISRGCEKCRQRRVKCDERKPHCLKCKKIGKECPGYRNLANVMFRDESERTVWKCSRAEKAQVDGIAPVSTHQALGEISVMAPTSEPTLYTGSLREPLSSSIQDLSVNFFANKFGFEGPKSYEPRCWFMESYLEVPSNNALRAVIEAIGLAGLSNIYYAPQLAIESKQRHCRALAACNRLLSDPSQATQDTTLMTIHLLSLFETVNFENWEQYYSWATHIRAVTVLFGLRGQEQFSRERGAQLYVRIRSSILAASLRQCLPVPPALVYLSYAFQTSITRRKWRLRHVATPGSMFEIALRIVNLRAAVHQGDFGDPQVICNKALDIDHDLEAWAASMDPEWNYGTGSTAGSDWEINDTRFVYPNRWVAEAWNSWRALRILINQLIIQTVDCTVESGEELRSAAIRVIRRSSAEMCISVSKFDNSPVLISWIEALYCIACEQLNDHHIRTFAANQLRHISATMGIRQAALFADSVSEQDPTLGEPNSCQEKHRLRLKL